MDIYIHTDIVVEIITKLNLFFLQIQFCGNSCKDVNDRYFLTFGAVFVCLGAVAFVQLCLCIWGEHSRRKCSSLTNAYKFTIQKFLYFLIICATVVRGTYYLTKWRASDGATSELWLVYYPLLLTSFSLIVGLWAEDLVSRLYNGMFALIILTTVVFFLIYGVEVYFKFHGAESVLYDGLDAAQVHMSRTGLIAQACLQLFIVLFLILDGLKQLWMDKVSVPGLNLYDIGFRLVEFGVALWFPCVLWNCFRPEELWVLNPRRIFKQLSIDCHASESDLLIPKKQTSYGATEAHDTDLGDCWICYDNDRQDAGALIKPCKCRGDVSTVHHGCLKKWLAECVEAGHDFKCKICGKHYKLERGWVWQPNGVSSAECLKTLACLFVILGCPAAAILIANHLHEDNHKLLVIGGTICIEVFAIRIFASSILLVYKKMRLAGTKILGTVMSPIDPSDCPRNVDVTSSKRRTRTQSAPETEREVVLEVYKADASSICSSSDISNNDGCTEVTVQQRLEKVSDNCNAQGNSKNTTCCDDQNPFGKESLQNSDSSNDGRSFNADIEYQSSFADQSTDLFENLDNVLQDSVTFYDHHDYVFDSPWKASERESLSQIHLHDDK
ncbi:hypothetical protein CHS0354_015670 [Potamilus streckersoni]|uniref:RING-CH-type domain-containing protein n=1 Tax=Potamilus streckersoni TaxID=2493646 RepID=A0AAE0SRN7_9BIVA|nr:hypothetical protein CHS0354_015670 [Potamilus streckersoni]